MKWIEVSTIIRITITHTFLYAFEVNDEHPFNKINKRKKWEEEDEEEKKENKNY